MGLTAAVLCLALSLQAQTPDDARIRQLIDQLGADFLEEREPASLEVPNLVVTFSEAIADPWYKWHEDFVIKGLNGDDKEKGGSLVYLTPDMKELFTITFKHLGIFKLTPEKVEAGSENIRRVKAEMYCEEMTFDYGQSAWA